MESRCRAYASSQNENKILTKLKRPTSHLTIISDNASRDYMNKTKNTKHPLHNIFFLYIQPRYALLPEDYHNGLIGRDL